MHRDRGQTGRAARLFFRLGSEWLALDAKAIAEVVNPGPIHRVPHRSNQVFLGIMNLRGQIVLCVSLHGLLGIETHDRPARIVILRQSERVDSWAFPADEVAGIERVAPSAIHAAPTTLVNPAAGFGKAVIAWNGRTVDLLDEQRLQAALEGNCS
jgi:chemotaxis-related protein WspD